uniref:uncharacterized protein LOC131128127 isoform X2 n=1 Tax=Doryrhamphus excisus TaxID=161450 RepID=UPI0025AE202E|nr:uncharacterized protein LOC131128127 isoform X2 [Doryrhamphus excisus]
MASGEEFSRTREENERQLCTTYIVLHTQDDQQLIGGQEERPPLGRRSTLRQEDPQPPHVKEEEDDLCIPQEGECLQGWEEADLPKLPPTGVSVKTEDHEDGACHHFTYSAMDDERLILGVENHTVLYDTAHPFYKDNPKKEKAWEAIAMTLGVGVEECCKRWRLLRDQFVKYSKKDFSSGSDADSQRPCYKYAEIMSFLRPHIQHRSPKSNLRTPTPASKMPATVAPTRATKTTTTTSRTEVSGASVADPDRSQTPSSVSTAPSPAPSVMSSASTSREVERPDRSRSPVERTTPRGSQDVKRRRRRRSPPQQAPTFQDRLLDVLQKPASKPAVPNTTKDEVYYFALSLVPMMLRLSQDGLRKAKLHILQTLHSIEDEESRVA